VLYKTDNYLHITYIHTRTDDKFFITNALLEVHLPHSLHRSATVKAPANRLHAHSLGRYQTCKKKKKDDHDHKLMHIISVSKHSRDRNTETREINIESVFETKKNFLEYALTLYSLDT